GIRHCRTLPEVEVLHSVFAAAVFQTELVPEDNPDWADIYFDLQATGSPQDSVFIAIQEESWDRNRYFPMSVLF
ncbi:hypothetical protein ACW9HV_32230, partial [Pseudomonas azotoformans]